MRERAGGDEGAGEENKGVIFVRGRGGYGWVMWMREEGGGVQSRRGRDKKWRAVKPAIPLKTGRRHSLVVILRAASEEVISR